MQDKDKPEESNEKGQWVPKFPKDEQNLLPNAYESKPFVGDTSRNVGPGTALKNCYHKMEIRKSPLEGFGVFAKEEIKMGEILEEIPFVVWPAIASTSDRIYEILRHDNFISKDMEHKEEFRSIFGLKHPSKYYFKWFPPNADKPENEFQCLPLGYGPVYNSANALNNASWTSKEKVFIFQAIRNILPDEEIFTYYGYMVAENDTTFEIGQVFGFGMEYAATNDKGQLGILLRNIRFMNDEDRRMRLQEKGCQEMLACLKDSNGRVKVKKISVIDNGQELHPFEFPPEFNLQFTFMKLKEFKETRFKIIKFVVSYVNKDTKKEHEKEILWTNHNG